MTAASANKEDKVMLAPFDLSVTSGERAARTLLRGVFNCLDPLELDVEEIASIELVLAEALNNIVEHAYSEEDGAGPIYLRCTHQNDGLHFVVRDLGKPMPDGKLPVGSAHNLDVDVMDLPEGGFGWFMIRDLAKDLKYTRNGSENRLDVRLAVATRS